MQTSTKLDRYRPNVRKNDISRHIASPATHCTVNDQPISIGIVRNVTKRSARAKCISIASILDGLLMRRSISSFSTVKLHTADITINTLLKYWNFVCVLKENQNKIWLHNLYLSTEIVRRCPSLKIISIGGLYEVAFVFATDHSLFWRWSIVVEDCIFMFLKSLYAVLLRLAVE